MSFFLVLVVYPTPFSLMSWHHYFFGTSEIVLLSACIMPMYSTLENINLPLSWFQPVSVEFASNSQKWAQTLSKSLTIIVLCCPKTQPVQIAAEYLGSHTMSQRRNPVSACNPSNLHRSACFGPLSRENSPSCNLPATSPDDITTVKDKDTSTTGQSS